VAFANFGRENKNVLQRFQKIGISGNQIVGDLWRQKDIAKINTNKGNYHWIFRRTVWLIINLFHQNNLNMIQLKSKYIALSFLLAGICISAQNPVIQTHFTPDPAPMVYKNKMYVFTGDDIPGLIFIQ
jgi:hypothetical protein